MLFTKARVHIDDATREWIDEQWPWLVEKLNMGDLSEHLIIEPTDEFFPHKWEPSREAIENLFATVVEYAEVDPARVELGLLEPQDEMPAALIKQDDKYLLPLEISELGDPAVTIAILARKLALLRLTEAGLDMERDDLPLLMDLACVVMGLGIFNANAAVPQVPR
ncbi:MAG: hypothetical protein K8I27_10765 [Planctomycetes bacterium]|nr:hypothetical protein [Planctomycetota bacterium]